MYKNSISKQTIFLIHFFKLKKWLKLGLTVPTAKNAFRDIFCTTIVHSHNATAKHSAKNVTTKCQSTNTIWMKKENHLNVRFRLFTKNGIDHVSKIKLHCEYRYQLGQIFLPFLWLIKAPNYEFSYIHLFLFDHRQLNSSFSLSIQFPTRLNS